MLAPVLPFVLVVLVAGLVWLRRSRRPESSRAVAVAHQHFRLLRGELLSRSALDAARHELQLKLDRGDPAAVEAALKPGLEFVVQIRALAEIGSEMAVRILERQLRRRIATDRMEQAWYRIDAFRGLRAVNRIDSLPAVLEAAEIAVREPLGHLVASEVVACPGFAEYLEQPQAPLGRSALRVLSAALKALRRGLAPPALAAGNRVGEAVSRLVRYCPDRADPFVALAFVEVLRNRRQVNLAPAVVIYDPKCREAVRRQAASLAAAEPVVREYLLGIETDLLRLLPRASVGEQESTLETLAELHCDVGTELLPLIQSGAVSSSLVLPCLRWSATPAVGQYLCDRAMHFAQRRRLLSIRKHQLAATDELRETLLALRGHPSADAERILCRYSLSRDPAIRSAALSGLGWWEPVFRAEVIGCLRHHRDEVRSPQVRWAALSALARLGERAALNEIRARLVETDPQQLRLVLDRIVAEGITLLWPEFDRLTEADDPGVVTLAWDALEHLREQLFGPLG